MRNFKGTITENDQIECLLRMCDKQKMWEVLREKMKEPWVLKEEEYKELRPENESN